MMNNTSQSGEDPTQLYTWKELHLGCGSAARDQEGQGGLGTQVTSRGRKLPGLLICQTEKWLCPSANWAQAISDPGTHPGPQA